MMIADAGTASPARKMGRWNTFTPTKVAARETEQSTALPPPTRSMCATAACTIIRPPWNAAPSQELLVIRRDITATGVCSSQLRFGTQESHPHRVLADVEDDRDRLALAADLVRRRVAVIAASANAPALAAKAATATGTGTTSSTMPSTPASAEVALGPIPNLPKAVRAACRAV